MVTTQRPESALPPPFWQSPHWFRLVVVGLGGFVGAAIAVFVGLSTPDNALFAYVGGGALVAGGAVSLTAGVVLWSRARAR